MDRPTAVGAPFSIITAIVWIELHGFLASEAAEADAIASTGQPSVAEAADG